MADPLTDEDLAAIDTKHVPLPGPGEPSACAACSTDDLTAPANEWPCDAARLVAEVRRLRALVAPTDLGCACPYCLQGGVTRLRMGIGGRGEVRHANGRVCQGPNEPPISS